MKKFKVLVKKDQGRGKSLGFPTANFNLDENLNDGIYVGKANAKPALIFVGANITFGESRKHGEVYILDFQDDLYDQEIEVEILQKLRENKKFDSSEELIEQMKKDEEVARKFFGTGSLLSRG
jgi:riboflavin kinase/FMN adenylyltransferase